jgi:hypothetical protein
VYALKETVVGLSDQKRLDMMRNVALSREVTNAHKVLVGKPAGLGVIGRIILKWISKKVEGAACFLFGPG